MFKIIILFLLSSCTFCKNSVNYLTWSLENGTDYNFLEDAIILWKIKPLEFARVEPGKGDVKIYFTHIDEDDPRIGYAYKFDSGGLIYLREDLEKEYIFYVLQHEFGHVLGLNHSLGNDTVMLPYLNAINVTDSDRNRALQQHECRFDSVTRINFYTYLVFSGSTYKRLDFNSLEMTRDQVWHPFITIVDSMYRHENGNYILISNREFFEFDIYMKFVRQGFLESIFPYVPYVDAVLKLKNGTTFVFSNLDVYRDDQKISLDVSKHVEGSVRGVFELIDGSIQLVDRRYVWTLDKNFNYRNRSLLCKTEYFSILHCCDFQ